MDNKLQELTQKLYNEGLSKGKEESEKLVADARVQAEKIVSDAKKEANNILKNASQSAEDMKKNTMTEVALASREVIGALKNEIENLIVLKGIEPSVNVANADPEFIKDVLLAVARNWDGSGSSKTDLAVLLPESKQKEFDKVVKEVTAKSLHDGLDVKFDRGVKSGFKIGPKGGGYYISFSDEDFNALLKSYLRPRIAVMLFPEK